MIGITSILGMMEVFVEVWAQVQVRLQVEGCVQVYVSMHAKARAKEAAISKVKGRRRLASPRRHAGTPGHWLATFESLGLARAMVTTPHEKLNLPMVQVHCDTHCCSREIRPGPRTHMTKLLLTASPAALLLSTDQAKTGSHRAAARTTPPNLQTSGQSFGFLVRSSGSLGLFQMFDPLGVVTYMAMCI